MRALSRRDALISAAALVALSTRTGAATGSPDTIFINGRILTHDAAAPDAEALAVSGEYIVAAGKTDEILRLKTDRVKIVDLNGRRVIPGLIDSHMHFVRGGLSYNLDVRWDGVPSLKIALERLRDQVDRTPHGQWVRVGGGWSQFQFEERRLPTIEELDAVAPDTPVYVLYFYDQSLINHAGLKALGMSAGSKALPGGIIQRTASGEPTGVLQAHPLPATITDPENHMPPLSASDAANSVQQFMQELNRLGLTSVIDPGGVGQPFPDMYHVVSDLAKQKLLTVRLAMYLLPQTSGGEVRDFENFMRSVKVGGSDRWYRFVGGGEILVQKAMDWDLYTTPPVVVPREELGALVASIEILAKNGWSLREHATFDSTISLYLDALEQANQVTSLRSVRWAVDHAELISEDNLQRVARMGGGIAVQHRAAFHGELGRKNFGAAALTSAPPVKRMLKLGIPVGAGTDATRDTTYNPWVCLQWLVTGRSIGGEQLTPPSECIDIATALRLYSHGSAWFSGEESIKGTLSPGKLADFAVLSQDALTVSPDKLHLTESMMTVVGGKVVYGRAEFSDLAPPIPNVSPQWSPTAGSHGGYYRPE